MEDDDVMAAIHEAVAGHCGGQRADARARLESLWDRVGPDGDPLHRCALAHFLADVQYSPADSLAWNVRALAAADALCDDRARRHHPSLSVQTFYPSLHLNLAEDYRALGQPTEAWRHLRLAEAALAATHDDRDDQGLRLALTALRRRLDAGSNGGRV